MTSHMKCLESKLHYVTSGETISMSWIEESVDCDQRLTTYSATFLLLSPVHIVMVPQRSGGWTKACGNQAVRQVSSTLIFAFKNQNPVAYRLVAAGTGGDECLWKQSNQTCFVHPHFGIQNSDSCDGSSGSCVGSREHCWHMSS